MDDPPPPPCGITSDTQDIDRDEEISGGLIRGHNTLLVSGWKTGESKHLLTTQDFDLRNATGISEELVRMPSTVRVPA